MISERRSAYLVAIAAIVAMSGCGGGSSAGATVPVSAQQLLIQYEFAAGTAPLSANPAVVYDAQFADPDHDAYLLVTTLPSSSAQWSSDSPNVLLSTQQPFTVSIPGVPAPTAPPGDVYVQGGSAYGFATVKVLVAGSTATLDMVHFPSLAAGCGFRYTPAFAFDPDRVLLMQNQSNWSSADLYETVPTASLGSLDPCYQTVLATGTAPTYWIPNGGKLIPISSLQDFVSIQPSQWSDQITSFENPSGNAVIFKTIEGRIVKAVLPVGPYEVSDAAGVFAY